MRLFQRAPLSANATSRCQIPAIVLPFRIFMFRRSHLASLLIYTSPRFRPVLDACATWRYARLSSWKVSLSFGQRWSSLHSPIYPPFAASTIGLQPSSESRSVLLVASVFFGLPLVLWLYKVSKIRLCNG